MLSEHSILRELCLYYMSAFKDFLKIVLGGYSAFVRISGCNNGGLHLCPVCLDTGQEPSMRPLCMLTSSSHRYMAPRQGIAAPSRNNSSAPISPATDDP